MKSVRFQPAERRSIVVVEGSDFEPGPGEVAVCVLAASAGPFDLGPPGDALVPTRTPGVGGFGLVRAVGEGVVGLAVGDRVVVDTVLRCLRCDSCLASDADECTDPLLAGVSAGIPGAMAEEMCLPEANVHVVPTTHGTEGVLLPYAAWSFRAFRVGGFLAGDTVVVVGAGLLGAITTVVAEALGARSIAVVDDRNSARDAVAGGLRTTGFSSADVPEFNSPDAPWTPDGPEVVVSTLGDRVSLRTALQVAGARTSVILLDLAPAAAVEVEDYIPELLSKEVRIDAFASTSRDDFRRVTQLWLTGVLDLSHIPLESASLDELASLSGQMSSAAELPYRFLDLLETSLVDEEVAS